MRRLLLIAAAILAAVSALAQVQHTGSVELMEIDNSVATFQVQGIASKKSDTSISAKETVFHCLFDKGVEGFNNDEKIVETVTAKNKFYLEKFFEGKNAPMNRFVSGVQQTGTPTKDEAGMFTCSYTVSIKYKALSRDLVQNRLREKDITE